MSFYVLFFWIYTIRNNANLRFQLTSEHEGFQTQEKLLQEGSCSIKACISTVEAPRDMRGEYRAGQQVLVVMGNTHSHTRVVSHTRTRVHRNKRKCDSVFIWIFNPFANIALYTVIPADQIKFPGCFAFHFTNFVWSDLFYFVCLLDCVFPSPWTMCCQRSTWRYGRMTTPISLCDEVAQVGLGFEIIHNIRSKHVFWNRLALFEMKQRSSNLHNVEGE